MTSLIINMPHLQNRRQRYGALLLSLLCWGWFLMPLLIVSGWLMGFRVLAQEVVWLGGWKSLIRLSEISAMLVVGLTIGWLLWTLVRIRLDRPGKAPAAPAMEAAAMLGADASEVAAARGARVTTVQFGPDGQILALLPEPRGARREQAVDEVHWLAAG